MNARMLDAAQEIYLSMRTDKQLHQSVNAALWEAATGRKV